jgi:hypothetical protein
MDRKTGKTPMKLFALCLAFLLLNVEAFADPLSPRDVVKVAIEAAQEDKLGLFLAFVDVVSIQGQKDQPRSPQEVVQLMKGINLKDLKLDDPRGTRIQGARTDVSLGAPIKLKFVILCTGLPDGEPRWKIVEIHRIK